MAHRLRRCLVLAAAVAQIGALAGRAAAQVPPSAAGIAACRGLHAAAASGDLPALTKALRAGADIDARDCYGRTALLVAAHGSRLDIVRALSEAGADIAIADRAGVTSLEHARRRGYAAMVTRPDG